MQTSYFLAKLIGPVASSSASRSPATARSIARWPEEFLNSNALIFLAGIITLPAGLAIVLTHNVWSLRLARRHHDHRLAFDRRRDDAIGCAAIRGRQGRAKIANPLFTKIGAAIWLAARRCLDFFRLYPTT